ncbi:MAG: cation:proton antiporter [Phycisphaeraceae bacterium]|nr:cation:proton antiporter [Phycisphaeraceae bacterium]
MPLTWLAEGVFTSHQATLLLFSLALLLGTARLLGELARQFKMPSVLGEILAGIVLGPTLLGRLFPGPMEAMFPLSGNVFIGQQTLTLVSVTLLLLVAGLEVDLAVLLRQGKAMVLVSVMGMVLPFVLGFGGAWLAPEYLGLGEPALALPFALFMGIAMSITALPVIVKILLDLNLSKSDLGALILSAAMVNDLVGWIGFAMVLAMLPTVGAGLDATATPHGNLMLTIGLTLAFLGVMLTLGRWLAHRLLPVIQARLEWPGAVMVFIMVVAIGSAAFTEWLGVHSIFGAFIAGVALGDSRHLRQSTREHIHQFITNIFAPIFFASIGLRLNFAEAFDPVLVVLVLVVAVAGKLAGGYWGARWGGLEKRQSMAVGAGMVARGAMEIILGQLAYDAGLITEPLFVAIVIMALATSLISGPAIARLVHRHQRRKLSDLTSDRQYIPRLVAHGPRAAHNELAQAAERLTGLNAQTIAGAVWAREQIMRTGIGDMLAVPHARLDDLSKPCIVIGGSERGIDFDASDGQPARLICLLLSPTSDANAQIEMLDLIARTFQYEDVRRDAFASDTFIQLLAAIKLAESRQNEH